MGSSKGVRRRNFERIQDFVDISSDFVLLGGRGLPGILLGELNQGESGQAGAQARMEARLKPGNNGIGQLLPGFIRICQYIMGGMGEVNDKETLRVPIK